MNNTAIQVGNSLAVLNDHKDTVGQSFVACDVGPAALAYDHRVVPVAFFRGMLWGGLMMASAGILGSIWAPWPLLLIVCTLGTLLLLYFRPAKLSTYIAAISAFFSITTFWYINRGIPGAYAQPMILSIVTSTIATALLTLLVRTEKTLAYGLGVVVVLAGGVLIVAEAVLVLVLPLRIVEIFYFTAEFRSWIAQAEAHAQPAWNATSVVVAVVLGLCGFALLAQAVRMIRLTRTQRALLQEHPGIHMTILDLKPSLSAYLRNAPLMLLLAILGSALFAYATSTPLLISALRNIFMLMYVDICSETRPNAIGPCFAEYGVAATFGLPMLVIGAVLLWPLLGSLCMRYVRRYSSRTAARRLVHDQRPPVVFLRSFADDQVLLTPRPLGPIRFAVSGFRGATPLDHMLVEDFMHIGPPKALGRAAERGNGYPPFGAVRDYVEDDPRGTPEYRSQWRQRVMELVEVAHTTIIVFDGSIMDEKTSLSWELSQIGQQSDWHCKTVILAHPDVLNASAPGALHNPSDSRNLWAKVAALTEINIPEPNAGLRILGLRVDEQGAIKAATVGQRVFTSHYLMALRFLMTK